MELISLSDVERIESKRTVIKVMNVMKEDLRDFVKIKITRQFIWVIEA